jgi:hypothetical protein
MFLNYFLLNSFKYIIYRVNFLLIILFSCYNKGIVGTGVLRPVPRLTKVRRFSNSLALYPYLQLMVLVPRNGRHLYAVGDDS